MDVASRGRRVGRERERERVRPREEGVKEGEGREGGAERRRGTRATVERGKEENERTPYFCFTVSLCCRD